jgi:peptide/nickel transport system permease protein
MFRFAFRRLLWLVPSVLGVSLLAFLVLSLLPEPAAPARLDAEQWRRRLAASPLFFEVSPADVRSRVAAEVQRIVAAPAGSPDDTTGQEELARLGGAALPVVLPELDALGPSDRTRVALALAPIAERMGLPNAELATQPQHVVVYWNRFWGARAVEFSPATARSAVRRYARYGTEARAAQLRLLDTFALPYLIEALHLPRETADLTELRRVVGALSAVTGRDDRIRAHVSLGEAGAVVYHWQRWWLVYQDDYVRLTGSGRVAAFVMQSRYGKWVYETVVLRMGLDEQGRPVLDDLLARCRVTLTLLALGLALAYLVAVPLGASAAYLRGRVFDRLAATAVIVPYAASPMLLGALVLHWGAPIGQPMVWAVVTLALALAADPMRQSRAALLPVLTTEYVRASRARGAGPMHVLLVHGLRNALAPVATRMATEMPVAITGCFVLEQIFGLRGVGSATLDAVARHDTRWLMAVALGGSVLAVVALVTSDVAYATLDPRLRSSLLRSGRRRA